MKKQKVVIIEDERDLASIIHEKLALEGYDALIAENGETGLALVAQEMPELILLDVVMPKLDGYEVLEKLRADAALSQIPVIVISNSGQPVDLERARSLGARDFLIKAHFDPGEVIEKVRALLPLSSVAAKRKKTSTGEVVGATDAQSSSINGEGTEKRILFVEDDEFLSGLAAQKFEKEGWKVLHAVNGEEALRMLREDKPQIVLLDIVLPDINGFDILERAKKDKATAHIPIILLSNLGQQEDIKKGKKLGAADYLVKAHFTLNEVLERVEKVLAQTHAP